MATAIGRFNTRVLAPTGKTLSLGFRLNYLIWTKYFDLAWETIPLHEKLTWVMFVSNTLAILTLIEILALKV